MMILDALVNVLAHGLLDCAWWQVVLYTLITTHLTIVSVTIFLHRHQAHRALELHPIPSHLFRFWLWLGTGMVTKEFVAVHRKHHAKCETEEDPHSPQTRGLSTLLLRGVELYRAEAANPETITRYGHNTPNDWLERALYTGRSSRGIVLGLLNVSEIRQRTGKGNQSDTILRARPPQRDGLDRWFESVDLAGQKQQIPIGTA